MSSSTTTLAGLSGQPTPATDAPEVDYGLTQEWTQRRIGEFAGRSATIVNRRKEERERAAQIRSSVEHPRAVFRPGVFRVSVRIPVGVSTVLRATDGIRAGRLMEGVHFLV